MKEGPRSLMFRDLPNWIQDLLRNLSREGYIYVGHSGVGLSHDFRRTCMKLGTLKAIDQTMEYHSLEDKLIVDLIATEGPRWVSYARILEYCTTGTYEILRQKE